MSTYRREHYLAKLRPFYNDSGLIKVITGIRRCGKSSLLITVLNELFEQGIPESNKPCRMPTVQDCVICSSMKYRT